MRPPAISDRPAIPQNTDPFVFGERFLYTFCAQPRTSAKRLQELAPSSVIMFGSISGGSFVLDTVLVVADSLRHSADTCSSETEGLVPDAFALTTLEAMYAWPGSRQRRFTLYRGATPRDPIDGMYSFVPCRPLVAGEVGFPRPALDGVAGINPKNARAVAFNFDIATHRIPELWNVVVDRVLAAGCALGTRVDLPA